MQFANVFSTQKAKSKICPPSVAIANVLQLDLSYTQEAVQIVTIYFLFTVVGNAIPKQKLEINTRAKQFCHAKGDRAT